MIKAYKVQITGIISITERGIHPENWDVESLTQALTEGAIDLQITELVDRAYTCGSCGKDEIHAETWSGGNQFDYLCRICGPKYQGVKP